MVLGALHQACQDPSRTAALDSQHAKHPCRDMDNLREDRFCSLDSGSDKWTVCSMRWKAQDWKPVGTDSVPALPLGDLGHIAHLLWAYPCQVRVRATTSRVQ